MNYILKVNEEAPYGRTRYYLYCGGITPKIGQAWTTKDLREARRVCRSKNDCCDQAKIVEITDKKLFEIRLKNV